MNQFIASEIQRCLERQKELSPSSAEYAQLLRNLEALAYSQDLYDTVQLFVAQNAPEVEEAPTPEPIPLKTYVVSPEGKLEEEPTSRVDMVITQAEADEEPETYDPEEVRAALVKARSKGLSVKELLTSFGVDSFSSFPAGRYHELMVKLRDA